MHWTKKTVYSLITAVLLAASLYLYVDNIFLPYQFKQFITLKIQEALRRPVRIREIHFTILRGFVIYDLTVYQGERSSWPFIHVEEASFPLILAPAFKGGALLIPAVHLKQPYLHLIREGKDAWNFSDLLPSPKASTQGPLTLLIRKITVDDGEIVLADQSREEKSLELISGITLDLRLSLNKIARFRAQADIPRREGRIQIKGNYNITTRDFSSSLTLKNIHLAQYLSLFPFPPDIAFKDGILKTAGLTLNFQNQNFQARGNFILEKAFVGLAPRGEIAGEFRSEEASLNVNQGRLEFQGRLNAPSLRIAVEEKIFETQMDADIKSLGVFQGNISLRGQGNLRESRLTIGENSQWRAQAIEAKDISLNGQNGAFRLQAGLDIKQLDAAVSSRQIALEDLTAQKTNIAWQGTQLNIQTDLALTNGRFILGEDRYFKGNLNSPSFQLTREDNSLHLEGKISLSPGIFQLNPKIKIQDNAQAQILYQYDPSRQESPHQYKGGILLSRASVEGIPFLDTVQNIRGEIQFETDRLRSDKISLTTQDADIELSGSVNDFLDPALDIQASSPNINLERLFHAFPALAQKSQLLVLGTASVEAAYTGKAVKPLEADIKVKARLKETTVAAEKFPLKITDISGLVDYQKDLVTWTGLQGRHQDKVYTLNGQLNNFARPVVDLTAVAQDLSVTAQIKILHDAFQLSSCSGKYLNTDFDIKGDVHLFEDAAPDLDLRGKFTLNLEDLPALFFPLKNPISRFQPQGVLATEALFKGKPLDWRNWQFTLTGQSPRISLLGYHLDNVSFQHEQRDQHISKCDLSADIYDGKLNITASADIRGEAPSLKAAGRLEHLDLAKLRKDKLTRNQYLAGRLSALVNIEGPLPDLRQLKGTGSVSIAEGYLWKFNILDGILGALLVPGFQDIVFTDASADFLIEDGRVSSDEVWLDSSTLSLKAKGWIDLNQNILFDIAPVFGEWERTQSTGPIKGLGAVLAKGEDYIGLKLTGTLSNPRYKIETFPGKVIEKTTDILKEGLKEGTGILKRGIKGILEEIF